MQQPQTKVRITKQVYSDVPVGTIGEVKLYSPDAHNPFPFEVFVPQRREWIPFKEDEVKWMT